MVEKSKELYREYFKNQLDLIFDIKAYQKNTVVNRPSGLKENQVYDDNGNVHEVNSIGEFKNGHAIVEIIEQPSKEIIAQVVDALLDGKDIPTIPINKRYNFIDENFVLTFNHSKGPKMDNEYWFKSVRDFHHGVAVVVNGQDRKRYIKEDGSFLIFSNYGKGELCDFIGNYGLVLDSDSFYLVDVNDKIRGTAWLNEYDSITNYRCNKFSHHLNLVNTDSNGTVVRIFISMNKSFVTVIRKKYKPGKSKISNEIIKILDNSTNLRDYTVSDKLGNYELCNHKDKYVVKYSPIMVFDERFTLCMYKNQLHLYDRAINKYTIVGNPFNTFYDDHLIVNYRENKIVRALLIYNHRIIDITEYYREKLTDIEDFKIIDGIELLNESDFCEKNKDKIREIEEQESQKSIQELLNDNERLVGEIERNVSIDYGIGDYESLYFPVMSDEGKGKH